MDVMTNLDLYHEHCIKQLKDLANAGINMGHSSGEIMEEGISDEKMDVGRDTESLMKSSSSDELKVEEIPSFYKRKRRGSETLLCQCQMCVNDPRGRRGSLVRFLDQACSDPFFSEFRAKNICEEHEEDHSDNNDNVLKSESSSHSGYWDKNNKYHETDSDTDSEDLLSFDCEEQDFCDTKATLPIEQDNKNTDFPQEPNDKVPFEERVIIWYILSNLLYLMS